MNSSEIEAYLSHYRSVCPEISEEELVYISESLSLSRYKNKQFYMAEGQVQRSIGFLVEGLLRVFYVDERGNEITTWFVKENEYITDYPSFIRQCPAKFNFQCIEPCVVVNLPYTDMQEGYSKFKNIERYGRLVAEEVVVLQQSRIESFLFQNAEQRYLAFMSRNPTLFNRISLTDLSSYLGIERQSLSRIRKSLTQK
ncbi:Crp/Fnr family transcriptional regulator [Lacihabitans sp. CCS-44]|uniref:Crp/Fnr family transcriptional regulator n=1 Tax=Lacihabitans sp. CCS-44 TaxID=2487331 RepID=UPI0020CD5748|nr:Crp/Fnr family transcriptional regulator [Lacihabitans sp. CCS-44]MCP9756827.1 Crp/Fnr family transcriptional regulator [Lacihabitans sp. CCS-44]